MVWWSLLKNFKLSIISIKMFACLCLNILIETGSTDSEIVTVESLNLDDLERNDSFFQQPIMRVTKLININKIHSSLVKTRTVGQWDVHCCVNCVCEAYAVHKIKGASCVLISSKLKDSASIRAAKAEDLGFSKVFNIIVFSSDIRRNNNILKSYPNCDAEAIIKNLRLVMTEYIKKESLIVEERINKYAEEQYEILNNLKDSTYKEHESLVKFIEGLGEQDENESTKTVSSAKIIRLNDQTFSNLNSTEYQASTKPLTKRQKSSPSAPETSIDAEGLLFEFEEGDDVYSQSETEIDSDREDNVEGAIAMPTKQKNSNSIAKSLPMNIPTFISQAKNHSTEDLDDLPQEDNLDIAASIKALARSVHGDAVFGELPRPRFSTQI